MTIPELNDKQLNRLSEFLVNFSILTLATLVIPNLIGIDRPNLIELALGVMISLTSLLGSLILLKSHD